MNLINRLKFTFSGRPAVRVVICLMLLVTIGNFYHQYKHGSAIQTGRVGIADEEEAGSYDSLSAVIKVSAVLGTPFLFALSLKPVGFYFATPFFIALIIIIFGERRWT